MESRRQAYSEFVKLGLWEVCFNNYFHHSFQFHYAFSGCHWVYSSEYRLIWEFVMPRKKPAFSSNKILIMKDCGIETTNQSRFNL